MLSRANAGLIRRLFEIEVPEIYDGIVEIKTIAREAGFRTKIAVVSHDPKIDSVGACVGVRGTRVKNIVQEIGGEKIDIVRWCDNIEELVANALQPVEIVRTFADAENEHILVVVPDEQLSLAIGKSGQNIRLTSKLTGWKVDVVRQSEAERVARDQGIELAPAQPGANIFGVVPEQKAESHDAPRPRTTQQRVASIFRSVDELGQEASATDPPLSAIEGVTERQAQLLAAASFTTARQLLAADRATLLAIPGMGEKTLDKILDAVKAQA
jgi:transcription antitermination factor NusA-like protein